MTKCILFTEPDGALTVVHPVEPRTEFESEGEYLSRIAAKAIPPGVAWRAVDVSELPASRTDRGAWRDHGADAGVKVCPARKAAIVAAQAAEVNRKRAELGLPAMPDKQ